MLVTCENCGQEFNAPPSRIKKSKTLCCSSKCSMELRRKDPNFVQPKRQKNEVTLNCVICNSEFKVKPYRKDTAKTCCRECNYKYLAQQFKGEGGPAWKGGVSTRTKEDKYWAKAVIERDKECVKCGSVNNLQAHHLKHFAQNVMSRLDLNNGITLCATCHSEEHPELPSSFITKDSAKGKSVKECPECGNLFVAKKSKQKFCSKKCSGASKKNGKTVNCPVCNKQMYRSNHRLEMYSVNCCSTKCAAIYGKEKIKEETSSNK